MRAQVKLADAVIDKGENGVEAAGSRVLRKKSSGSSGGQAGERDKEREAAKPLLPSESRSAPCQGCWLACMSCRAVPCRAMPCRAVPCRAVPCRAVACRAMHAAPCPLTLKNPLLPRVFTMHSAVMRGCTLALACTCTWAPGAACDIYKLLRKAYEVDVVMPSCDGIPFLWSLRTEPCRSGSRSIFGPRRASLPHQMLR